MVAVRVRQDGESREVILRPEDFPRLHSVSGVPNGKPVSKQVLSCSRDLKLNLHLPVAGVDGLEKRKNSFDNWIQFSLTRAFLPAAKPTGLVEANSSSSFS